MTTPEITSNRGFTVQGQASASEGGPASISDAIPPAVPATLEDVKKQLASAASVKRWLQ